MNRINLKFIEWWWNRDIAKTVESERLMATKNPVGKIRVDSPVKNRKMKRYTLMQESNPVHSVNLLNYKEIK